MKLQRLLIFAPFFGIHDPIWQLAHIFKWFETQPPTRHKFFLGVKVDANVAGNFFLRDFSFKSEESLGTGDVFLHLYTCWCFRNPKKPVELGGVVGWFFLLFWFYSANGQLWARWFGLFRVLPYERDCYLRAPKPTNLNQHLTISRWALSLRLCSSQFISWAELPALKLT